jgi:hypothetical protein
MLEIKHQRAFCDHGRCRVADSTLLELLGPTSSEERPTHWTAETIHFFAKVLSYRLISAVPVSVSEKHLGKSREMITEREPVLAAIMKRWNRELASGMKTLWNRRRADIRDDRAARMMAEC